MTERQIIPISALTDGELAEWLQQNGQPAFRHRQICDWLYRHHALAFDEMSNLPKELRQTLDGAFLPSALRPLSTLKDDEDGTVKWLSALPDGNTIESVLIPAPDRQTVCISTQVGCAVRCAFCASGRHGLVRNLSVAEIIDQVRLAAANCKSSPLTNIVVMGIGEPLHNRENLVTALNRLGDPQTGMGIGARHITISTSGIVPEMRRLADERRPWNLAISLHAVDDAMRARLIPPQNRFPIKDILEAATYYRESTSRMVTLEYALCRGFNDSADAARRLAAIANGLRAKVNLIPCNNETGAFLPPAPQHCRAFLDILLAARVQATLRLRKGDSIKAACGQLRAQSLPDKP